ncbi:MAG: hypothetical protein HOZ81_20275 [Streptomyces sp.]|nr:hypothetical protein [Streptomyces sp.]NUS81878.1 hypothetical protein [Streptomyces sp.]
MTARQVPLILDPELEALLAVYERAGETPREAIKKALRLRAGVDGHLNADGRPKRGTGRIARRQP